MNSRKLDKVKNIKYLDFNLQRKINLTLDLMNLIKIIYCFKKIRPDLLITCTPKSIIIGSLLYLIYKVKRIHFYTGIFWSQYKFIVKLPFILLDKLNIITSNKILFDSYSQIIFFKKYYLFSYKFKLISNGSIKGVKTGLFKPNLKSKNLFKTKYNLPLNSLAIIYFGRMNFEKGILELLKVFNELSKKYSNIYLFLYGHDEMNIKNLINKLNLNKNKIYINNYIKDVHEIIPCFDIFVLPSKREGFGNSVIEASSCELPCLTSNIFGLENSSIENVNSLKFKIGNFSDFKYKFEKLLNDKQLRHTLGKNGRKFVKKNFESDTVLKFIKNEILLVLKDV